MIENMLFIILAFAVAWALGHLLDRLFERLFSEKPLTFNPAKHLGRSSQPSEKQKKRYIADYRGVQ